MKKLYISAFCVLLGAFSLSSCSDFLDSENKSAGKTADEYFATAEGLEGFRTYSYYSLKKIASMNDIQEDGTDLFIPGRGKEPTTTQNYSMTPKDENIENFYVYCYQVINNANGLIKFGGDKYKTEALFLRTYGYYQLTQHFGAVPYSEGYIDNANRNYPRADLKTIYDKCIADLEDASKDNSLPETSTDGHVSHKAILALLSKFCLAAGWDLETTLNDGNAKSAEGTYNKTGETAYFEKAAKYADEAISGIDLSQTTFADKWSPYNEDNNKETFFSVQYDRANFTGDVAKGGHKLQNDYGNYYGTPGTNGFKQSTSYKIPTPKSLFLWAKGDDRYQGTFMTTFYNYNGDWTNSGYYAYYNNSANRDNMDIAYYYAPYYVTQAEFEQYLKDNKSRFVQGSNKNACQAELMQNPILVYTFNADGSFKPAVKKNYDMANILQEQQFTPSVKKWDDPATIQENGNTTNCYRDIVLFHASSSYLDAAEAYFMLGETDKAMERINAVRNRSHAGSLTAGQYDPDYQTGLQLGTLDLILDERARECYAEMTRWMDLRRTRQLVRYNVAYNLNISAVSDMSNNMGEVKWYRPIPEEEINSNTAENMKQNPGY